MFLKLKEIYLKQRENIYIYIFFFHINVGEYFPVIFLFIDKHCEESGKNPSLFANTF